MLNAAISGFSDTACEYLRLALLNPVALVLAVLMVLQRYAGPFINPIGVVGKHFRSPVARTFGVGVIILQLFYAPYLRGVVGDEPLAISLYLLCTETVLQVGLDLWEYQHRGEFRLSLRDLMVENKYQDITVKFRLVLVVFWVQIALMGYFLFHVNNDEKMHAGELDSILKWLVALNLTQVTSDDEAGTRFHAAYWLCLLNERIPEPVQKEKDRFCELIPVPFKIHWTLRLLCDFIVNGVCRVVIMGIAPIYLADTEPMDFIKDSLALFFVTRLDDYDDIVSLGQKIRKEGGKLTAANLDWLLGAIEADEDTEAGRGPGGEIGSSCRRSSRVGARHRLLPGEEEMSS